MATTLATTRTAVLAAMSGITTAQKYRRRHTNYQYPAIVIGWPSDFNVRPVFGDARDVTLDVFIGVEVTDDESSDDLLSGLLESVITALQTNTTWDVQSTTQFSDELLADDRVVVWARVPLLVLT